MTAISLEALKPGELFIRCADGSLIRSAMHASDVPANENNPRSLLRELIAMKRSKKR